MAQGHDNVSKWYNGYQQAVEFSELAVEDSSSAYWSSRKQPSSLSSHQQVMCSHHNIAVK